MTPELIPLKEWSYFALIFFVFVFSFIPVQRAGTFAHLHFSYKVDLERLQRGLTEGSEGWIPPNPLLTPSEVPLKSL